MLTILIVIISQCTQISNHYVVHLTCNAVCQFTSIKKSINIFFASVIFGMCDHKADMTECEQWLNLRIPFPTFVYVLKFHKKNYIRIILCS